MNIVEPRALNTSNICLGISASKHTDRYTHISELTSEKYHSAVARTVEEARKLIEDWWQYVMDLDDLKLFRRPK